MNKRVLDQAERTFWNSFICSQKPEYWFTFNFVRPYGDEVSIEAFKFAMRAIQRRVPSNRPIRGAASIERTWKNNRFNGCLHIHALLWGFDGNVRDPEPYVHDLLHKCVGRLVDAKGRPMADASTIDIQRVYAEEGVAKYATKDTTKKDDRRRSRVWLIRPTGLDVSADAFT